MVSCLKKTTKKVLTTHFLLAISINYLAHNAKGTPLKKIPKFTNNFKISNNK